MHFYSTQKYSLTFSYECSWELWRLLRLHWDITITTKTYSAACSRLSGLGEYGYTSLTKIESIRVDTSRVSSRENCTRFSSKNLHFTFFFKFRVENLEENRDFTQIFWNYSNSKKSSIENSTPKKLAHGCCLATNNLVRKGFLRVFKPFLTVTQEK